MAADLTIPFYGSSAFQHIESFHYRVPAIPCPDLQHRSLDCFLLLKGIVIRKQIQLIDAFIISRLIGIHAQPSEEETVVSLFIKLIQQM